MGLLEQEIKELRQLRKDFVSGKASLDSLNGQIAVYSQIEKGARLLLQAQSIAAKFGKQAFNRISKTSLVGDGVCIEVEDMEEEKVYCPDQDKVVSRQQCLDFSGDSDNFGSCHSCENFKTTRRLLLGQTQEKKGL